MGKWSLDLTKYAEAKKKQLTDVRKAVATILYTDIVKRTPVDTGRARGNWQITVGHDDTAQIERLCKEGDTSSMVLAETEKIKVTGDEKIYIHNNLPYITMLEFGGYPKEVKKGTYVKGQGYVIKSEGGYSKRAPHGMVGVAMTNMTARIRRAIRKAAENE